MPRVSVSSSGVRVGLASSTQVTPRVSAASSTQIEVGPQVTVQARVAASGSQGPPGPPGPGPHVGPTPPTDTSLVWVDTSP